LRTYPEGLEWLAELGSQIDKSWAHRVSLKEKEDEFLDLGRYQSLLGVWDPFWHL
jgi:hypothetical protein